MAWADFKRDFKWPAHGPWHIAFKAGERQRVRRECLEAAVEAGAAVESEPDPSRSEADPEPT